jgi:LPXTG-motif cell wall-anchored protein
MRRRAVMLFCALALAVPATAAGQSAGDEQYEDPFAPGTEEPQATPEAAPAPAAGGESSAPAPAPAPDPAPEANAAQQLPYTGADVEIVLAAGAALLAGGVALRIRVRA